LGLRSSRRCLRGQRNSCMGIRGWGSARKPSRGVVGLSTSPLCTTAWRAWLRSWPAGWRVALPW
jgi:hypothetical protein